MSEYGTMTNFSSSGNILPDTALQIKCGFGHGKRKTKSDSPAIRRPRSIVTSAGPMVEIFDDRVEITNPGTPLMDTLRFIDIPPKSRNEELAAFMRRIDICEERGSGIDKVIESVEGFLLPPPDFISYESSTKAILFTWKDFSEMDWDERVRACYQHACLCSVSNQVMTNASLRSRFGLNESDSSTVSRIIQETIRKELIKPADPDSHSKRHAKYIPFWQ